MLEGCSKKRSAEGWVDAPPPKKPLLGPRIAEKIPPELDLGLTALEAVNQLGEAIFNLHAGESGLKINPITKI